MIARVRKWLGIEDPERQLELFETETDGWRRAITLLPYYSHFERASAGRVKEAIRWVDSTRTDFSNLLMATSEMTGFFRVQQELASRGGRGDYAAEEIRQILGELRDFDDACTDIIRRLSRVTQHLNLIWQEKFKIGEEIEKLRGEVKSMRNATAARRRELHEQMTQKMNSLQHELKFDEVTTAHVHTEDVEQIAGMTAVLESMQNVAEHGHFVQISSVGGSKTAHADGKAFVKSLGELLQRLQADSMALLAIPEQP